MSTWTCLRPMIEAERRIADLTASIEEGTGKASALTAEIKNLEKEVAANQEALDKANAILKKEKEARTSA